MRQSEPESYQERFARALAENELFAVRKWDGNTGWTTDRFAFGKGLAGALLGVWFLAVFVYGFYKIVAG